MNKCKIIVVILTVLVSVLIGITINIQRTVDDRNKSINALFERNDDILTENVILKNQVYFKNNTSPIWKYRIGDDVRNSTEFSKLFNFTFKGTIISFRDDGYLLIETPYMVYAVNEYWTVPINGSSEGLPSHVDIIFPVDAQDYI